MKGVLNLWAYAQGLFPILGGRLLKSKETVQSLSCHQVSNPWREAIEDEGSTPSGFIIEFPILGGRLLKMLQLVTECQKKSFQSLEGGYFILPFRGVRL